MRIFKSPLPFVAAGVSLLMMMSAGVASASSVSYSQTLTEPRTTSFDISYVDPATGIDFIADRTNNAVDMINANVNPPTFEGYIGQGLFVGTGPKKCLAPGNSHACGGPNGVVVDSNGVVWTGDGNSTIKALNAQAGTGKKALVKSIPTGGEFRADELAYDPKDQVILIANDAEGFLTFINTATQSVAGHFYYEDNAVHKRASVAGHSTNGGGIEQSVWDPQTGLFYQAVPGSLQAGSVDIFDPVTEALVGSFSVPNCLNGPTGLALGSNQRLLGACDNGAVPIDVNTGQAYQIVPGVGGADEVWFNPGDRNFYLAISGGPDLGVVGEDDILITVIADHGGHSVAANATSNVILAPDSKGTGVSVFVSKPSP